MTDGNYSLQSLISTTFNNRTAIAGLSDGHAIALAKADNKIAILEFRTGDSAAFKGRWKRKVVALIACFYRDFWAVLGELDLGFIEPGKEELDLAAKSTVMGLGTVTGRSRAGSAIAIAPQPSSLWGNAVTGRGASAEVTAAGSRDSDEPGAPRGAIKAPATVSPICWAALHRYLPVAIAISSVVVTTYARSCIGSRTRAFPLATIFSTLWLSG